MRGCLGAHSADMPDSGASAVARYAGSHQVEAQSHFVDHGAVQKAHGQHGWATEELGGAAHYRSANTSYKRKS